MDIYELANKKFLHVEVSTENGHSHPLMMKFGTLSDIYQNAINIATTYIEAQQDTNFAEFLKVNSLPKLPQSSHLLILADDLSDDDVINMSEFQLSQYIGNKFADNEIVFGFNTTIKDFQRITK